MDAMKASRFADAQKVFIIKYDEHAKPNAETCRTELNFA